LTHILVAVLGLRSRHADSWPSTARGPATQAAGFQGWAVLGLHAAPTGTLARSEQLGPGPFGGRDDAVFSWRAGPTPCDTATPW